MIRFMFKHRKQTARKSHRVAVVQDYLCAFAGGERVALSIARMLDAPMYTSLYEPARTFDASGVKVHPSWLNRFGFFRANHRRALPLLALTFSMMKVDADLVVCTTAGWSHGARTTGRKIAYWESPAKWLYRASDYQAAGSIWGRTALSAMRGPLIWWDRRAVKSVDSHIANSTLTRDLLMEIYGVEATVIPCPRNFSSGGIRQPMESAGDDGYLLCVCRLLPYKNVDAVALAMSSLPSHRLCVVGSGPEAERLQELAPPNVIFLGTVSEDELRWLYAHCSALVTASREDFGLTPLEAASFGKPTVALRWGGFLDTIIEGQTGVFFDSVDPESIAVAIRAASSTEWNAAAIVAHSDDFTPDRFAERFRLVLQAE
jgi:glycosyltransferase involved in cell wall biosynthesis